MLTEGTLRTNMFIAMLGLLILSASACAKDVVIGFGKNKSPFVIDETDNGLEIDIFREVLAYSGHKLSVVHVDNKGLVPALLSKRVEGIATARDAEHRFCEVQDFIEFDNIAISLKSHHLNINSVQDLKEHTVVAWQNAYQDLGADYYQLFKPDQLDLLPLRYYEHHNQEAQNAMFWAARAEVIVVDKTIFAWYRKMLADRFDTSKEVEFHPIFGGKTYFSALFNDQAICEDFREGLQKLKAENRYRSLFEKYTR